MTRRASETDFKPATPTAGDRTRRSALGRGAILGPCLNTRTGGELGATLRYDRKPAPPPSCNVLTLETTGALPFNTRTLYSELQLPPRQPQVEVRVVT